MGTDNINAEYGTEWFLLELNTEVPYINLSKPWWTQSANECFSIINKLYVAVNDISLSYFDSVMPMAMNIIQACMKPRR